MYSVIVLQFVCHVLNTFFGQINDNNNEILLHRGKHKTIKHKDHLNIGTAKI